MCHRRSRHAALVSSLALVLTTLGCADAPAEPTASDEAPLDEPTDAPEGGEQASAGEAPAPEADAEPGPDAAADAGADDKPE